MFYFVTFFFVVFLNGIFVNGSPNESTFQKYFNQTKSEECGFMHISITTRKKLAINWSFAECRKRPDKIILYKRKFCDKDEELKKVKITKNNKVGVKVTDVLWNITDFPRGWHPNDQIQNASKCHCYKYYLTSFRKNKELKRQCLKINPIWMHRNKKHLKALRIGEVFFPGTHRSGAIGILQNYDFWGQLVFGIRYFDIQVGIDRYKNKAQIKIYGGGSLYDELEKVQQFLDRTKKEVIILDFDYFHRFENYDHHEKLIKDIKKYINEKLLVHRDFSNHQKGPTLRKIWKAKKRVIVNYRNATMVKRYKFLWNSILIKKGNKGTPEQLKKYILTEIPNIGYDETMGNVVAAFDDEKGTAQMDVIDKVNPKIPNWYRIRNIQKYMNILAVDFFESTRLPLDCVWVNKFHKPKG